MTEPTGEWTLHPIAEREIVEERRRLTRGRRVGWALAAVSLGLCPLTCVSVLPYEMGWLVVVAALVLGVEAIRRTSANADLARAKRREIRDAYAAVEGWAVEMTVFQGAAATGIDRGAVWFEDGRLYFVGERTSFGLAPSQAAGDLRQEWPLAGLRCATTLRLRARTAAGPVSVGFNVLPHDYTGAATGGRSEAEFVKAVKSWLADPAPPDGQLPPLAVGPDAPSALGLLTGAILNAGFWATVAAALLLLGWRTAWWAVPPVAAFAGCVLVLNSEIWAPRHRWRAWRDRRRLDRVARQNKPL